MKYTEKFNVMWDVERNTDTIFEMVKWFTLPTTVVIIPMLSIKSIK